MPPSPSPGSVSAKARPRHPNTRTPQECNRQATRRNASPSCRTDLRAAAQVPARWRPTRGTKRRRKILLSRSFYIEGPLFYMEAHLGEARVRRVRGRPPCGRQRFAVGRGPADSDLIARRPTAPYEARSAFDGGRLRARAPCPHRRLHGSPNAKRTVAHLRATKLPTVATGRSRTSGSDRARPLRATRSARRRTPHG